MTNTSTILDSSLRLVPHGRLPLFWIILIISVIALVGNTCAIKSVIARKQKCLHKVCIISLAISDIFSTIIFATNNLDTLSNELKVWELGEFLCHFIPMGQVLGTTASSMTLLVIASDRYQSVTIAIISQRWNPNLWKCLTAAFICLVICSVTSYPMYLLFTFNPIQIVHSGGPEPIFEDAFLCAAIDKDKLMMYYLFMAAMVFLPIIVIFFWFYYQIAALVWRHRKPFVSMSTPTVRRTKTAQVQRKIRTFKVIVLLMVSFIVCRLPYWMFFSIKLLKTLQGPVIWYIDFSLIALNMLNSALNPFLYAFLNQTMHFSRRCQDLVGKIGLRCCYFKKGDSVELHKNKPFVVNCENKEIVETGKNLNSNSKIKFIDTAHFPTYIKPIIQKELLI